MNRTLLDFTPVRRQEISFSDFAADLTLDDFRQHTNAMVDTMLDLIADCVDEDVAYLPEAPSDTNAETPWTLGHVIVHTTATAEFSAAIAAEMARGVEYHGPSRYEFPWQSVTTVEQCRHRLEESRRMRLASLGMWPDKPNLDIRHKPFDFVGEVNALGFFALGLFHDDGHLEQIAEAVRTAKAARL